MQSDVLFPSSLFLAIALHPRFPAFSCSRVFARERQGGDVSVRNRDLLVSTSRVEPHGGVGERLPAAAVENIAFDLLAVFQRDGDVSAIVECLLQRNSDFLVAGQLRNPAFQVFAFASRSDFQLFGIGSASLGYTHEFSWRQRFYS